ncbi:patatin family protein [Flavobacterium sp. NKUCC04_CG]|uniref:patatin-like phospholipase family protein n=1 Tax=Flavobacterium sp. NKUCC04_CG TaxID=2842121 RepID=UPI001C5BA000|nr:patatin-like phospholipase family protein [Flavobacterium sp. NKUCC04_CG]MBW3520446.1 patatin-like phospholipase family protein [Flavobacterium sp. NKUCC04_CG]
MRALVISGGGSKGAFAGGLAEYLLTVQKREYEILIGSSTGSLLVPLLSIGETQKLKKVFTSVTQSDIFNICPFIITEKNGVFKTKINHFGVLKTMLKGKKTFGESKNLRDLIGRTMTAADYSKIQQSGKDVIVTVSNLSSMQVEYKNVRDCNYDDYCDWVWASTSMVPFMSLVNKNNFDYADGGMGDLVPIYQAILKGATEIDIIILKNDTQTKAPIKNAFVLTSRVFEFMLNQIATDDLILGKIEGLHRSIVLNFYYPPEQLTTNSLIFNPEKMKAWWELGFHVGEQRNPKSQVLNLP